jgi:hypothetical protein
VPNGSRGPLLLFLAVAAAVVVWQIALFSFDGGGGDAAHPADAMPPPAPAPREPAPREPEATRIETPAPAADEFVAGAPADYALTSNELATLEAARLPADRPVILGLVLPVPSPSPEPLRVVVVGEDGRELRAQAKVADRDGASANLEIEAGWVTPGTYLIHLTTNERSALPLRRYPLEVR